MLCGRQGTLGIEKSVKALSWDSQGQVVLRTEHRGVRDRVAGLASDFSPADGGGFA